MSKLSTEEIAKSLASASSHEGANIFDSIKVVETPSGKVIAVKQDKGGNTAFITVDDQQIRTVSYLFKMSDIPEKDRLSLATQLLVESLSLPLVSFGIEKEGDEEDVVIFGSMSTSSGVDELIEEVKTVLASAELVAGNIDSIIKA